MDRHQNAIRSDFDLLNRSKSLSFLSPVELRELTSSLRSANFSSGEIILSEAALGTGVHFLLKGIAKITCLNRSDRRVTVGLLAPGPIPEFLSSLISRWHFRCEAYSDCRVGRISWDHFDVIAKAASQSALRTFHQNNLMQWYQWSLGFLGLDTRERLVFMLRQLCSNFGVVESRGTLLPFPLRHKDLADLVGATRPRVTEHLAELEREHLLIRQGRQLIVRLDRIEKPTVAPMPDRNGSFTNAGPPSHFPK